MDFAFMANVMYLISDNSQENGGTRLIPGSHKWPVLDYKTANSEEIQKMAVSLNAPKGTAIVWEGRVWHGNGLNRSGSIRSNISTAFLQPWVKPQEYHQYSVREEVIGRLSEKQKHILGFSSFGTLGGHDGSSVSPANFDPTRESIGILKP
jgi:ectoine hydroxylase-related dioxygenase (phytanoyl-CoA dioxygenase family)